MPLFPVCLLADEQGNIRDCPGSLMVANRRGHWFTPAEGDLIPLPEESELFMLPGRQAVGYDRRRGKFTPLPGLAVAAFAAPGHTLSAHPAYFTEDGAPILPLLAYGAVGYAKGRFWVCATKVDRDRRQRFTGIGAEKIERECVSLLKKYPHNRLMGHIINNCVRRYSCPAARNFALGRYEAPLPTSRTCNASCLGCISARDEKSSIEVTPQCRLDFTPTASEIVEVMRTHERREKKCPIYSFGQGCEGDPLMNVELLRESILEFRAGGGTGTINCNSNGSRPEAVGLLADAGLTSLRVSLNSARRGLYASYYRPAYAFEDVCQSMRLAREKGVFTAINLLYFPGITDTETELATLSAFCRANGVCMIQWRNLNIDPALYAEQMRSAGSDPEPALGLRVFMRRLREMCPWLIYGYFNPFLGERAKIVAPMPG